MATIKEIFDKLSEVFDVAKEDFDVSLKTNQLDFLMRVNDYAKAYDEKISDGTGLLVFLQEKIDAINFDLSFWEPGADVKPDECITMAVYDGEKVYKAHGRRDDVSGTRVVLAHTKKCAFECAACPPHIDAWGRRGFLEHVRPDLVRQLIEIVNSRREKKLTLKRNVDSLEYMLYCDDKLTHTVATLADVWCLVSPLMDYREVPNG